MYYDYIILFQSLVNNVNRSLASLTSNQARMTEDIWVHFPIVDTKQS